VLLLLGWGWDGGGGSPLRWPVLGWYGYAFFLAARDGLAPLAGALAGAGLAAALGAGLATAGAGALPPLPRRSFITLPST
jgi:hypothetical protein